MGDVQKDVLAIVVTYQGEDWVRYSLGSLMEAIDILDVAVIDNSSRDATRDLIIQEYATACEFVFLLNENLGFGRAHNIIFQPEVLSRYKYVLLLNQDAAISIDNLQRLIGAMAENRDYGILSPIHYYDDDTIDYNFSKYVGGVSLNRSNPSPVEVRFVNAAIWLVRSSLLETIGGFHPAFEHYGEDANFVHRATFVGSKIGVVPAAKGYHFRDQSPALDDKSRFPRRLYVMALSRYHNPNLPVLKSLLHNLDQYLSVLVKAVFREKNVFLVREHLKYFGRLIMSYAKGSASKQVTIIDGDARDRYEQLSK